MTSGGGPEVLGGGSRGGRSWRGLSDSDRPARFIEQIKNLARHREEPLSVRQKPSGHAVVHQHLAAKPPLKLLNVLCNGRLVHLHLFGGGRAFAARSDTDERLQPNDV